MAKQSFTDAMEDVSCMVISHDETDYNGYYCDPKLDRDTLPEGWYAYDIRSDDDGCGIFVELCHDVVFVNNAGSFFTETEIPELSDPGSSVLFYIDPEDWKQAHLIDDLNGLDITCPKSDSSWYYSFE